MDLYWKAAAALLISLILKQTVTQKDLSLVFTVTVTVMTGLLFLRYLEPILDFLKKLESMGDLQGNMLQILLKALGISLICRILETLCRDSGNSSLGLAVQMLGTAVILWLSLPVFNFFLDMIQKILGEL